MEQWERLKQARQDNGYRSGTEAANAMGVSIATYNAHENGHRGLTVKVAERYAKFFDVRSSWLLTGELPKHYRAFDDLGHDEDPQPDGAWGRFLPGRQYRGLAEGDVAEIDPYNTEPEEDGSFGVVANWTMPTDFLQQTLKVTRENVFLMAVSDDAMAPSIKAGDRVIVDSAQLTFRGNGLYVLRDRDGQMHIRRVAKLLVPQKDGEEISLSTDQPATTMFVWFSDINIVGKVVGTIAAI